MRGFIHIYFLFVFLLMVNHLDSFVEFFVVGDDHTMEVVEKLTSVVKVSSTTIGSLIGLMLVYSLFVMFRPPGATEPVEEKERAEESSFKEEFTEEIRLALLRFKTVIGEGHGGQIVQLEKIIREILNEMSEVNFKTNEDRYEFEQITKKHIPELIDRYLKVPPKERNFEELIKALEFIREFVKEAYQKGFNKTDFDIYRNFIKKKYGG